ncbi:MAG: FecR domain-containing protein [Myxococcaceae bacterium]|nr:FecR domain-containing protein [Myxococcaceae bacterium]
MTSHAQAVSHANPHRLRDLLIALAGLAVAVVSLGAALRPAPTRARSSNPVVAHVAFATGALQLRPAETLGWQTGARGDEVHESDAVYVPPGSEARVEFLDGTVLELDERSLVVIEPQRGTGRAVTLRQGAVAGLTGLAPLTLTTSDGTATLPPSTVARVDVTKGQLDVAVAKGKATVAAKGQTAAVEAGGRARVMDEMVLLPSWPVTLRAPEAQHRQLFRGRPPAITLEWQGTQKGARVQIAKDRLFAFVSRDVAVEGDRFELATPGAGVTWWRLVDARGAPVSEARRFSLVEDLAPANRLPRPGEVVLAPPATRVEYAWTPLPGVSRYLLEVSASQGFEPVTVNEVVSGTQVKLESSLAEGSWYWRVRAADDALGEALPSEATRFRIIHKAIPDAPELLNPEIEVTPSRGP